MPLKSLLLQLLSVLPAGEHALEVAVLVRAGAVFGFEAGAVRVTLSRLAQAGLVEGAGRGRWRLTGAASWLADRVGAWRDLEDRIRPWTGGWLGIATGGLGRTDWVRVRRRERALALYGFRELRPGLEIRPDNRAEPADALRRALVELGLEPEAPVFAMGELGPAQAEAAGAWDLEELAATRTRALAGVRAIDREGPLDRVAREMFLAGAAVLRALAFDPLLPDEIAPSADRRALLAEMIRFDDEARALWRRLLTMEEVA